MTGKAAWMRSLRPLRDLRQKLNPRRFKKARAWLRGHREPLVYAHVYVTSSELRDESVRNRTIAFTYGPEMAKISGEYLAISAGLHISADAGIGKSYQ